MVRDLYTKYCIKQRERYDIANIKGKLRQCEVNPLTKGQRSDIDAFYTKLVGHKVPQYWHEYFYSRNERFSVQYIPTSFYHKEIIYRLNNFRFRHAYVDKSIYDIYFPDINRPKTIVKNINGYFYDGKSALTREEALDRCQNLSSVVIKPTLEGMWGEGVKILDIQDGRIVDGGSSIESLFLSYDSNFIIQEKVKQNDQLSLLNPTSLNTLRILSYRNGNEVFILYAVVRIGRLGKMIDNETAGGINADIDMTTGTIVDCAYGTPKEKKLLTTDSGTRLKDFAIPSFDKVIDKVKELHLRLPYFNMIGWDWGIDDKGKPILIEWNRAPDLSQTAHGPAFGDMTEFIVKDTLQRKDTRF
ncbi:sugar-transfer associated ATP-grasp domain-containing protein [Porphyromonas somerae]|uniref:sugar-transfer associated ATP-grasp domain-containing protein n=1 Tax=Porphyromonas somerae TaxID=322095 RepID=UPI002A82C5F8|nr:sugar-transfer associated ATP-grasp domain-containing protein [Porphyromonas somerae]MDY3885087.1 sugar-transfer associated ATP-grasp domain-containing protein [Porphyromonas somerae]